MYSLCKEKVFDYYRYELDLSNPVVIIRPQEYFPFNPPPDAGVYGYIKQDTE